MKTTIEYEAEHKRYGVELKDPAPAPKENGRPPKASLTERSGIKQIRQWNKELRDETKQNRDIERMVARFKKTHKKSFININPQEL